MDGLVEFGDVRVLVDQFDRQAVKDARLERGDDRVKPQIGDRQLVACTEGRAVFR